MSDRLKRVVRSQTVRQSSLLIVTQGSGIVLAFALTVLITRSLDVAAYGTFRYAMTFLAFGMTLLQFGWPHSAARLLALEGDRVVQNQIVGACLILVLASSVIGVAITLVVAVAAHALGYQLPRILLWSALCLYVTLGQYMISSVCQGLNRIPLLAFQQVLPYVMLLPITAIQVFLFHTYSLQAAIIGYVTTFSAVITVGFLQLGVEFTHWRPWIRAIIKENRRTGFPIYVGGIFGVASGQLIAMWVAGFVDPARYGQYALALVVSSPLTVMVSSVGTVMFRSNSTRQSLPRSVVVSSLGFGALLGLAYFVGTETLLVRVFGSRYNPSVQMAQALGAAALLIGWGDIINRFLGAQGQGYYLCIAAVSTGAVGIVSAAVLLPRWDVYGAIAASVLGAVSYLGLMVTLYARHIARQDNVRLDLIDANSMGRPAPMW